MHEDPTVPLGGSDNDRTRSTAPLAGTPQPAVAPAIPARIGRYTIVRVLGEGGMGTVYEAEQDQPKRAVALKVIRAGYLSPQLLKRFEHESAVLGRLQHPGIAQVYEAGTVEDERGQPVPFFAMEFIRGVPLTEYVASKNLGTRERLELVACICDAVYHAHQKGVIHRDLKPGNILADESGQPKILDFGVARATDSDIQQTTLQTDVGQLIGTVPYMSPEQVSGDPNDLDTRSDVYALGVIAYELLAGRLPHDLQRKMIHEAARIIREEEPTRLSRINRTLRGDVETIVAKALEKDKVRRYQSAESFASDIRRYLKDEPIAARPASTWYQASKFARRNRGLVGGLAIAFVLLVVGLAGTAAGMVWALRERDRAAAQTTEQKWANAQLLLVLAALDDSRVGLERARERLDSILSLCKEIDRLDRPEVILARVLRARSIAGSDQAGAVHELRTAEEVGWRLFESHGDQDLFSGLALSAFTGDKVIPIPVTLAKVLSDLYEELERLTVSANEHEELARLLRRRAAAERHLTESTNETDTLLRLGSAELALGRQKEALATFRLASEALERCFPGRPHPSGFADRYCAVAVGLADAADHNGAAQVLETAIAAYAQGQPSDREKLAQAAAHIKRDPLPSDSD